MCEIIAGGAHRATQLECLFRSDGKLALGCTMQRS